MWHSERQWLILLLDTRAAAHSTLIMRTRYQHLSTGAYGIQPSICKYKCLPWTPCCVYSQGPPKRGQKMRQIIHSRYHLKPDLNEQVHYTEHEMAHARHFFLLLRLRQTPQAPTPKFDLDHTLEVLSRSIQLWMNRYITQEHKIAHAIQIIRCIGPAWCPQYVNLWTPLPPNIGHTFLWMKSSNLTRAQIFISLSESPLQSSSGLGWCWITTSSNSVVASDRLLWGFCILSISQRRSSAMAGPVNQSGA